MRLQLINKIVKNFNLQALHFLVLDNVEEVECVHCAGDNWSNCQVMSGGMKMLLG